MKGLKCFAINLPAFCDPAKAWTLKSQHEWGRASWNGLRLTPDEGVRLWVATTAREWSSPIHALGYVTAGGTIEPTGNGFYAEYADLDRLVIAGGIPEKWREKLEDTYPVPVERFGTRPVFTPNEWASR